ncbi:hypothetical protein SAMN05216308_12027 [Nitrosospira sp. Nsp13]|nr:hypothetical protein SAMN05216308_12027 [Nitrosospira sp. Nsp13]
MGGNHKSLDQQVIVLSGASSGIRLCTARLAAVKSWLCRFLISLGTSESKLTKLLLFKGF